MGLPAARSNAPGNLEPGHLRIAAALNRAPLEGLSIEIPDTIAALLGAQSVRLYLCDPLTHELYARFRQGTRVRELRLHPGPTSPTAYAAMTRANAFAWKRENLGPRNYVVAAPLVSGGDLLGVLELVHGTPEVPIEEDARRIFYDLAGRLGRRLQSLLEAGARATPYDFLLKSGLLSPGALVEAREKAAREKRSVESEILSRGVDKADLGRSLSEHFECPFVRDPSAVPVATDLVKRFAPSFLRTHAVLPAGWKGDRVEIVLVNPRNLQIIDDIGRQLGTEKLSVSVAVREDILEALEKVLDPPTPGPMPAVEAPVPAPSEPARAPEDAFDLAAPAPVEIDSAAIRLVNETIQAAVDGGASDIHMEPASDGGLAVRFRVDGVCHDYRVFRESVARSVVSRIKIMASMDIAEHRLPQDGKIRLRDNQGRRTDLRVAIIPTQGGAEDVVLRLLPEYKVLTLDQLGMEADVLDRFRKVVSQPHGIALCVGPTGSGKTTTLHAALAHLKGPEVKIWTAEDPVEITQPGVRQVQIHHQIGLTFDRALRAFLRCDPDIIMIGEIRDRETAGAAVEASLTGHLVLSTLHTNSAPETVTRLLEMGLDPFTFGSSLLGILAQRLIRRVCSSCIERRAPTPDEFQELREHYGDGAGFDALRLDRRKLEIARGKGCESCFGTGYKGRLGIHELLVVTPEVRRCIQKRTEADEVGRAARHAGMVTLKQDGIRKVLQGLTDLREVLAITVEEDL
jgi:type II secretory ATPase GspE/PulE/Tfp pilus assembly ATPase PilB-like protein